MTFKFGLDIWHFSKSDCYNQAEEPFIDNEKFRSQKVCLCGLQVNYSAHLVCGMIVNFTRLLAVNSATDKSGIYDFHQT